MRDTESLPSPAAAAKSPEIAPPDDDVAGISSVSLSITEGSGLSLWSRVTARQGKTDCELELQLGPDASVVVGRQEGGRIEYLDERYQPTQLLPESGERIVSNAHDGPDVWVSRGHFLLKGSAGGILFVNGVPRRGGGIRPPLNGTQMLEPVCRFMLEGEEYLIDQSASLKIRLPNGTVVLLRA